MKVIFNFFYLSFIEMILGWSLYFKYALKTGSLTFLNLGSRLSYSGIFKFLTIFEKNSFSSSADLDSLLISSPFLFSFCHIFIRSERLNSFPKMFVICYVLLIEISKVIFLNFFQKKTLFSLVSI